MNKSVFYDPVEKTWHGASFTPIYNIEANLGYLILQRLIQQPSDIFQICDDTGIQLTNSEIYQRSLKFAHHLMELGLKQNDIIGLLALNSENVAPLMFACFTLGIAINPLSILMSEKDISYHWSRTKPKVIFCDGQVVPIVQNAVNNMKLDTKIYTFVQKIEDIPLVDEILLENIDVEKFVFPDIPNISSTTALIMCSSGTTGMPKGVCKSHKQILSSFYPFFKRNLNSQDIAFCSVSSYWISHPMFLISSALYGMKLVITSQTVTPDLWMDIIERNKVTIVFSVPAFVAVLLKSNKLRKLETLKVVVFAGCPIPRKFIDNVKPLIPNGIIYCAYGSTEADIITCTSDDGPKDTSSGFPTKNVKIKITDESGNSLGPNEVGEICFQTCVPFPGYFQDPENTANSFDSSNFMKSGDIGYFDDEGYIYVIDRIKHMIKSKEGYRVTPAEIECVIDEIDGVLQSSIIGVEDTNLFIDIIYAFVIKDPSKPDLTEEYIVNYVNERVIDAKKISGVHFVDKFPMTASGKILNRELKRIAMECHEKTSML